MTFIPGISSNADTTATQTPVKIPGISGGSKKPGLEFVFRQSQQAIGKMPSAGPYFGPLAEAAISQLSEPIFDIMGPQAPLTNKIFGGEENFLTHSTDVLIKLAPLAVGIAAGGGAGAAAARAGLSRVAGGLLGDVLGGAAGGAATGAAEAVVRDRELQPSIIMGGSLGAVGGAFVNKLSRPGRALAKEYAERPGATQIPDIDQLDELIPFVPVETTEIAARRRAEVNLRATNAARTAYRKVVPKGEEAPHPAVVRMARKEAAAAAREVRSDLRLETEGEMLNKVYSNVLSKKLGLDEALAAVRHLQNVFVTRLSVTLARDSEFGSIGPQFANMIARSEQLKDHLEGQLVHNIWRPMLKDLPKDEVNRLIDSFLHGEGGQLSVKGLAAAGRWREVDDKMFEQMSRLGLMEEVSEAHPAAQAAAGAARMTMVPAGGEPAEAVVRNQLAGTPPKLVPLQYRTNHVPHYVDRAAMQKLSGNTPERRAFLEGLIQKGEAGNMREATQMLEEMLETPHAGFNLHIRSPFQHERELALDVPRERNFATWSRRAFHDYSRRLSQAKVFGPLDEEFRAMKGQLLEERGPQAAERLERLFRVYIGRPPADVARFASAGRTARGFSTISLLGPRVGLLQHMQLANTAARLGWRNTLEGLVAGWRNPELRSAAEEVGALLPSEHLMTLTEPMGRMAEWWVKNITQMPRFDRGARNVSALTGGLVAKRWAREYWRLVQADAASGSPSLARGGLMGRALAASGVRNRGERMAILSRRLEKTLGIPVEAVMQHEGELPIELLQVAMRNASHNTQFASTILDLPEARATHGLGKFIYTLRTFAKQQTPFVGKMVNDAVRHGDTGPIVRFLITYPALYAFARPYLDFLSGKEFVDDADQSTLDRVAAALEGALWTGMFGSFGDFINQLSAQDPASRLMKSAVGAPISQAIDLGAGALQAGLTGNTGPLGMAIYRTIPSPIRTVIQHAAQ